MTEPNNMPAPGKVRSVRRVLILGAALLFFVGITSFFSMLRVRDEDVAIYSITPTNRVEIIGLRHRTYLLDYGGVKNLFLFGNTVYTGAQSYDKADLYAPPRIEAKAAVGLIRCPDGVCGIAFSGDGQTLAAACTDRYARTGSLRLWQVDSLQQRLILPVREVLSALAISSDGKTLAYALDSEIVTLRDLVLEKTKTTLESPLLAGIAFSPDGMLLATATERMVKLWDTRSGDLQATLEGHTALVYCVAFSPDGKLLASAGLDRSLRVWQLRERKQTGLLKGHAVPIRCVAISPSGQLVATGSEEGIVKLWNVANSRLLITLAAHDFRVTSVAFAPDGQTLATASIDATVRLWDVVTGNPKAVLSGHTGPVTSLAFVTQGEILASGSDDGTIRLWDISTLKELK
jgi:WD40 repeat protein